MIQNSLERNRRRPVVEFLETRDLPAAAAREQYILELINEMRRDPKAHLTFLLADKQVSDTLDYFKVDRALLQQQFNALPTNLPPLAWNDSLASAALGHSQKMFDADTLSHQLPGEMSLGERITASGYVFAGVGENAFHFGFNPLYIHAGWAIDWGAPPNAVGGIQNPAGHRNNIMSTTFTDFGLGIVDKTAAKKNGPFSTENFGAPLNLGNPFVLGVVYRDANSNNRYDAGEGLGDVDISIDTAGGATTGKTSAAGYYQLAVPAGTYTVTASGGTLAAAETRMVTVGASNLKSDVKLDAVAQPTTFQMELPNPVEVLENAGTYRIKVTRTGAAAAVDVPVSVTDNSAKSPTNFMLLTDKLSFAAGDTEKYIELKIVNIPGANGKLDFQVALGQPAAPAQLGTPVMATVTILDTDPPAPAVLPVVRLEGPVTVRENAGKVTVKIIKTVPDPIQDRPTTVLLSTINGTALAGTHFTGKTDEVITLGVGPSETTIDIPISDDTTPNPNRTFNVKLSGPAGATLGNPGETTVTIEDDDAAAANKVFLSQTAYTVKENAGSLTVGATRTGDLTQAATVDFMILDGSAKNGTHFQVLNLFFTFTANSGQAETTIQIVNTPGFTGPLSFSLSLVAGGTPLGMPATATITIEDVDVNPGGGVGNAPTATEDLFVLKTGDPGSTGSSLLTNDTPATGLTARVATQGTLGTVTVNPDGTFRYVPGTNFWGVDTFSYQANNGQGDSNVARVTVMSHTALQVRKVFQQVLRREPDPGGWKYWTDLLTSGKAGLGSVASGIFESPERLDPIISQYYRDFLLRAPDQGGLNFWRGIWQRDGGPENVLAGMVASPEFYQSAGGTNAKWVTELYRRLLKRDPEPTGSTYWTARLDEGTFNRTQVVLFFVKSEENFRNLVREWHQTYLNRAATTAEVNSLTAQLLGGTSQRSVQISLINSMEYLNSPPPPSTGEANRL